MGHRISILGRNLAAMIWYWVSRKPTLRRKVKVMKRLVLLFSLLLPLAVALAASAQEAPHADPYKPTLDRLQSLLQQGETEWRAHSDVAHPEDPALNDSGWDAFTVRNMSGTGGGHAGEPHWNGTRVFRRWVTIPEKINGYAVQRSRVLLDLRFATKDALMITVFSNGAILYRGNDDDILPVLLTTNAQPGQKFLIAVRVVTGDAVESEFPHSELVVQPSSSRPDPALLRSEILAARPFIAAYADGKAEREQSLDAAVKAIDFSPLERGDQAGFDASLKSAQAKLESLKPWLQQFTIRLVGNSHIDMAWL